MKKSPDSPIERATAELIYHQEEVISLQEETIRQQAETVKKLYEALLQYATLEEIGPLKDAADLATMRGGSL